MQWWMAETLSYYTIFWQSGVDADDGWEELGSATQKIAKNFQKVCFFTSIYFFSNVDFPFLSLKLSFFYYICFLCVTISLFGCKELDEN